MVRSYDLGRPVPAELIDRIVGNGLRAPSAGFSQGWGFLVLDNPADVARFRDAVRPEEHPEEWFAANVDAPLLIIAHSNKDAYLDRYALPDKGFTDRSDAWWPAPGWERVSSASRSSGSTPTGRRSAFPRNSPRSGWSPSAIATSHSAT